MDREPTASTAIVMNASTFDEASDIDYFITNVVGSIATPEWIVTTYSQRNWVEVFYREAKGWLGLGVPVAIGPKTTLRNWRSARTHR